MFLSGMFLVSTEDVKVKTVTDDLSNKMQVIFNISSNYSFMLVCLSSRLFVRIPSYCLEAVGMFLKM